MLPNISIDNDRYASIVTDAKNMIVSLYPEWTDFNYHDPGITMLELFSWIKENQQYFMDQIGDENRKKYLKLLGISRRTKLAARAEAELTAETDIDVLRGTKFFAGDLCFEADERRFILKNDMNCCISYEDGQARVLNRRQLDFIHKLKILPFGREPKAGSCFYLGFKEPLPVHTTLRAVIEVFDHYEVVRNPIPDTESFRSMAEMDLEVHNGSGWEPAHILSDETHALLCTGSVTFRTETEMKPGIIEGMEGYFIRFCLKNCDYDIPPVIESVRFNAIAVSQRDTQSEIIDYPLSEDGQYKAATELAFSGVSQLYARCGACYRRIDTVVKRMDDTENCVFFSVGRDELPEDADGLRLVNTTGAFANCSTAGYGTGLPYQELDLNSGEIEYHSFEIMSEDPEEPGRYDAWDKVNDFSCSAPEDRHYIFDSDRGAVRFGNCIRGLAPEGEILIVGYVKTQGKGGNVKKNTINRIGTDDIPGIHVTNEQDACGGEDEETIDACFQRAQKMLKKPLCAVTYADYEDCVLKTPGLMIESCKVIPPRLSKRRENDAAEVTNTIVVKPYRPERAERLSDVYIHNIKNHLDQCRLLGTNIELIAPEYINVTIYADITVKSHYHNYQALVEDAVKRFFRRYKDRFGAELIYSELYGVIDRLECVSSVTSLSMDARGNMIRTKEGNIVLQVNGVVELSGTQYMFTVEQ